MAHGDPVFFCQLCRAKLNLTGLDEAGVSGQGFGIDESLIDLNERRQGEAQWDAWWGGEVRPCVPMRAHACDKCHGG
jgi:hypothetical protein